MLAAGAFVPGQALLAEEGLLAEIVVTARKQEESLQNVPAAVTALDNQALIRNSIGTFAELSRTIPNLQVSTAALGGTSSAQFFIRGIGQFDYITTVDQSVGVYIDDVYIARSYAGSLDLLGIERIEVLRGPQGTLYGRNTTGGAIKVITRDPSRTLEGSIELGAGDLGKRSMRGYLGGPLTDSLAVSIAAMWREEDGYGTRLLDNTPIAASEVKGARIKLKGEPWSGGSLTLSAEHFRKDGSGGLSTAIQVDPEPFALYNLLFLLPAGLPPIDATSFVPAAPHQTWSGTQPYDDYELTGASLSVTHQLGNGDAIRSITGYRTLESQSGMDFDGLPYPVLDQETFAESDQLSQEFQWNATRLADRLDLVGGLFYFRENAHELGSLDFFSSVTPTADGRFAVNSDGFSSLLPIDHDVTSYASYLHGSYALNPQWRVSLGLRYTRETKEMVSAVLPKTVYTLPGPFGRAPTRQKETWSDVSPKFGIDYRPIDPLMLYFSVSKAYRSGGFNGRELTSVVPSTFQPEKLWAFEIGEKAEIGGRARINSALFYYDYRDMQGKTVANNAVIEGNVAGAKLYGVEIETTFAPVEGLEISLAGSYLHNELTDLEQPPGLGALALRPDTKLINAPEYTLLAALDHRIRLGRFGTLAWHADYSYRSAHEFLLPNLPGERQSGYGLLNARVSLVSADDHWTLDVYGKNLGDEVYKVFAENTLPFGLGSVLAIHGRPREYGFSLRYDF